MKINKKSQRIYIIFRTSMNPLNAEMYKILYDAYINKKKCSYCGETGHTIRRCQHPSIHALRYHLCFNLVQHSTENRRAYLESISHPTLKMICVLMNKSLSLTRRETIEELLDELSRMSEMLQIPMQMQMTTSITRTSQKKIIINTVLLDPKEQTIKKDCPICYEANSPQNMFETNCGHTFCISCTQQHLKTCSNSTNCPLCRTALVELITKQNITPNNKHLFGKQEYCIK